MQATSNKLGLTDSRQLHQFEADVTTIRMAELEIEGIKVATSANNIVKAYSPATNSGNRETASTAEDSF